MLHSLRSGFAKWLPAACWGLFLSACSSPDGTSENNTSSVTYRRLTVVVDTPQGQVSGYSVNAGNTVCRPSITGTQCVINRSAEAAPVKLPNGKVLYALLSRKGNSEWTAMAPPQAWKEKEPIVKVRHYNPGYYPDFVIFKNRLDPKSVRFIDDSKPFENGYTIKSVYLSHDPGPKTRQIREQLPWAPGIIGSLSGNSMPYLGADNPADALSRSNFIQETLNAELP